MTVLDLAASAMRTIGSLGQGQLPNSDEAAVCLAKLNNMLDRWSLERLNLFSASFKPYVLTQNKQTYQIGPGVADFSEARPVRIQTASMIMPGTSVRIAMDLMTSVEWAALREKSSTGVLPTGLYCDYAFPISTLNVTPIPIGTISMELYSWVKLANFVTLQDTVALPEGYLEAMEYNLAIRIAPEFGMQVDPAVVAIAADGKSALRNFNAQILSGSMGEATKGTIPSQAAFPPPPQTQGQ